MAATQIAEMRPTHDAILDHILTRPHATLRELANITGYSVSWLSQVTRSDCFRAAYDARRGDVNAEVMATIVERLDALSHLAIDRMEEKLLNATDPDFVLDAFDKVLHRTGYAPNARNGGSVAGPANTTNNIFLVDKDLLGAAREKIVNPQSDTPPARLPETVDVPSSE